MPTAYPIASPFHAVARPARALMAGVALLALAGCATQAPTDESGRQAGQWERQQASVEAFDSWTMAGKAGLRTPDENTSANLDWNQTPY
ncbi:lipoprotein localization factor LolB, partial [Halomonas sp. 707D4]|nr:lipoprotein localization factor LolB [Halomonas sp. 707D4]